MPEQFGRVSETTPTIGVEQQAASQHGPPGPAGPPASPRLVTRGERNERPNAIIDWLAFTVDEDHYKRAVDWVSVLAGCMVIPELTFDPAQRGVAGFSNSAAIILPCERERVTVGKIAWGGASQRGRVYLSLSGTLCTRVFDWGAVAFLLGYCDARITRIDLAHDDIEGTRCVDMAVAMYDEGRFTSGGRKPSCSVEGDWKQVSGKGRTFYVGNRKHGKLLRVYEKGKQLGHPQSPWVRWEVEFHNRDRWIPYETLTEPDRYLAGAFPALEFVSEVRIPIRTQRRAVKASLEHLVNCLSVSYGKTLNAMRLQGLDADDILAQLVRPGLPHRMKHVVAACEPGTKAYGDEHGEP
jgi:phage replication initiation protein